MEGGIFIFIFLRPRCEVVFRNVCFIEDESLLFRP